MAYQGTLKIDISSITSSIPTVIVNPRNKGLFQDNFLVLHQQRGWYNPDPILNAIDVKRAANGNVNIITSGREQYRFEAMTEGARATTIQSVLELLGYDDIEIQDFCSLAGEGDTLVSGNGMPYKLRVGRLQFQPPQNPMLSRNLTVLYQTGLKLFFEEY